MNFSVSDPFYSPDITYSYDKVSCVRTMYYAHVTFCYLMFLSGLAAFVTRVKYFRLKRWHVWCGRCYILSIVWATASSLVIHNTGLPPATLISFIFVLGGVSIGWIAILIHRSNVQALAMVNAQNDIKVNGLNGDLKDLVSRKMEDLLEKRTFLQRVFSLKTLHVAVMFTSWINIAGRIFASDQSVDFTCYTYPVYKPLNTSQFQGANKNLTLVPTADPNYARLPWSKGLIVWGLQLSLVPFFGTVLIVAICQYFFVRCSRNRNTKKASNATATGAAEACVGNDMNIFMSMKMKLEPGKTKKIEH